MSHRGHGDGPNYRGMMPPPAQQGTNYRREDIPVLSKADLKFYPYPRTFQRYPISTNVLEWSLPVLPVGITWSSPILVTGTPSPSTKFSLKYTILAVITRVLCKLWSPNGRPPIWYPGILPAGWHWENPEVWTAPGLEDGSLGRFDFSYIPQAIQGRRMLHWAFVESPSSSTYPSVLRKNPLDFWDGINDPQARVNRGTFKLAYINEIVDLWEAAHDEVMRLPPPPEGCSFSEKTRHPSHTSEWIGLTRSSALLFFVSIHFWEEAIQTLGVWQRAIADARAYVAYRKCVSRSSVVSVNPHSPGMEFLGCWANDLDIDAISLLVEHNVPVFFIEDWSASSDLRSRLVVYHDLSSLKEGYTMFQSCIRFAQGARCRPMQGADQAWVSVRRSPPPPADQTWGTGETSQTWNINVWNATGPSSSGWHAGSESSTHPVRSLSRTILPSQVRKDRAARKRARANSPSRIARQEALASKPPSYDNSTLKPELNTRGKWEHWKQCGCNLKPGEHMFRVSPAKAGGLRSEGYIMFEDIDLKRSVYLIDAKVKNSLSGATGPSNGYYGDDDDDDDDDEDDDRGKYAILGPDIPQGFDLESLPYWNYEHSNELPPSTNIWWRKRKPLQPPLQVSDLRTVRPDAAAPAPPYCETPSVGESSVIRQTVANGTAAHTSPIEDLMDVDDPIATSGHLALSFPHPEVFPRCDPRALETTRSLQDPHAQQDPRSTTSPLPDLEASMDDRQPSSRPPGSDTAHYPLQARDIEQCSQHDTVVAAALFTPAAVPGTVPSLDSDVLMDYHHRSPALETARSPQPVPDAEGPGSAVSEVRPVALPVTGSSPGLDVSMDDCEPVARSLASETVHSQSPLQEPERPRPATPESSVADTQFSPADLTACAPSQEPVVEQCSPPAKSSNRNTGTAVQHVESLSPPPVVTKPSTHVAHSSLSLSVAARSTQNRQDTSVPPGSVAAYYSESGRSTDPQTSALSSPSTTPALLNILPDGLYIHLFAKDKSGPSENRTLSDLSGSLLDMAQRGRVSMIIIGIDTQRLTDIYILAANDLVPLADPFVEMLHAPANKLCHGLSIEICGRPSISVAHSRFIPANNLTDILQDLCNAESPENPPFHSPCGGSTESIGHHLPHNQHPLRCGEGSSRSTPLTLVHRRTPSHRNTSRPIQEQIELLKNKRHENISRLERRLSEAERRGNPEDIDKAKSHLVKERRGLQSRLKKLEAGLEGGGS